jgi:hypothetical protein
MNLLELQRRMATDVTRPLTPDFDMQRVSEDGSAVQKIAESYIKPNDRLSSFERLEIYNRQYWFRVIAAVGEDFHALKAVLGSEKFDCLVLAYLRDNPSTSFTLRNLGAKLPLWLEAHPEFSSKRRKLELDVAQLEWAYIEAFDSAAIAPLGEEDVIKLGEDSAVYLQPHVQLLALSYPVDELVLAVHRANPSAGIASNAVSERPEAKEIPLPDMRRSTVYLAVHRFEDVVYYRRLEREAYRLLNSLQAGKTLGQAIKAAFSRSKLSSAEQGEKIRQCFQHAAELGWFCCRPGRPQ